MKIDFYYIDTVFKDILIQNAQYYDIHKTKRAFVLLSLSSFLLPFLDIILAGWHTFFITDIGF